MTLYWIGVAVAAFCILMTLGYRQHCYVSDHKPWMNVFFLLSFLSWLIPLALIVYFVLICAYYLLRWIIYSFTINNGLL